MINPVAASVHVAASPERVFEHFTSSTAMTAWMGQWADLDPVIAGRFAVDIEGVAVRGHYLELDPPHRLVVSWGHAGSQHLPPGTSTVEITLTPEGDGTRVEVHHRDLPEPEATRHAAGWGRFLTKLANTASANDARVHAPKPPAPTSAAPSMEQPRRPSPATPRR